MLCVGKARLFDLESIELIEGPPDRILTRADFRPYQVWMSRTMLGTWKQPDVQGVLMGADMGLGKTATTLYALYKLLRKGHIKKVLIVAPKYVAENSWPGEIACWDFARTLTYSVVTGTEEERLAALRYPAEINIINRENLVWLKRTWGRKWPYDFLVYDEASRLKGGSKRVAKAKRKDGTVRHRGMSEFGVLARMRYTFAKVIELSGTPSPNGLIDLWGPIFIIDKGRRLGESRTAFERRWFQENEKAHKFTPFDHSEKEIMGNVKDVFFTLSSEDYLDLPPLIVNDKFVTLSPAHMKLYKKFEKERALDEWDVEAVNKGVLVNKLLQACLAKGTEVLTENGWKNIETIQSEERVWDGEEFVKHGGVVCRGTREVVPLWGSWMTEDHKVLTKTGWKEAREVLNGNADKRHDRREVWVPDSHNLERENGKTNEVVMPVRVWKGGFAKWGKPKKYAREALFLWMQTARGYVAFTRFSRENTESGMGKLVANARKMLLKSKSGLQELRCEGCSCVCSLEKKFFRVFRRYGGTTEGDDIRQDQRVRELHAEELPVGDNERARKKQTPNNLCDVPRKKGSVGRGFREAWDEICDVVRAYFSIWKTGKRVVPTYDIVDSGPRNRFVARGSGPAFVSHNCNGSIYRADDLPTKHIHDEKIDALASIIEESGGTPVLVAYSFKFDLERIKKRFKHARIFGEGKNDYRDWNAGKIPLMLVHPASAGHGLNFQHGGNIAVFYGLTWSLELYRQFVKRLHRSGQKAERVFLHRILAKGTADEDVVRVLSMKGATQDAISDAVRVRLKKAIGEMDVE